MALGLMNTNRGLFIMEGVFVLFGANKQTMLKAQQTQGLGALTKVTFLGHTQFLIKFQLQNLDQA